MRPFGICAASLVASFLLSLSGLAHAQTDQERSAARAAGEVGLQAYSAGNWQKALIYFRKAQSIVDSPTHLLYIARSEAKLNHLVEAREAYIKLDRSALPPNASDAFRQAKEMGLTELPAIETRLPYVTLYVTGGITTQIVVDQTELPVSAVGVPFPINPGEHIFQAMSDSLVSEPVRESFPDSAKKILQLHLALVRETETKVESTLGSANPITSSTTLSQPKNSSTDLKVGEYIAYGVGVLGVGTGVYFLIKWSNALNDSDKAYTQYVANQCLTVVSTDCHDQSVHVSTLDRNAANAGTLSTIGYVVGGLGFGTGVTLMLLRNGHNEQPSKEQLHAYVGPQSAGVWGSF